MSAPIRQRVPPRVKRPARWFGRAAGWLLFRDEADRLIDFVVEPMYEGFAHVNRSLRDLEDEVRRLRAEVEELRGAADGRSREPDPPDS